jgi:tetrahydromethanopterin S-methyltransferase subunit A
VSRAIAVTAMQMCGQSANARALYKTIITNGWISELSHAAYLGKELAKAELSLRHGLKYVQDGA